MISSFPLSPTCSLVFVMSTQISLLLNDLFKLKQLWKINRLHPRLECVVILQLQLSSPPDPLRDWAVLLALLGQLLLDPESLQCRHIESLSLLEVNQAISSL